MKQLIAHFGNTSQLVGHVTDEELEEILEKLDECINVFVMSDNGTRWTNITHADAIDIEDDPSYETHIDVRV